MAWHLLSLDAPTVATLWAAFLARSAGLTLPWSEPTALFVVVWMLYAGDRLLDARGLRSSPGLPGLEDRHRFHFRNRRRFGLALVLACPLALALIHPMPRSPFRLNLLLGGFLAAWLLLIHTRPGARTDAARLPKELAVGVLFPAAVLIPTVARLPGSRLMLLPEAFLFAAVCSLNSFFIYAWEHPHRHASAHWTTRCAIRHLQPLGLLTLASSLLLWAFRAVAGWTHRTEHFFSGFPALACAASVALLFLLHHRRNGLSALTLRASADACLLTPALLLALEWLFR